MSHITGLAEKGDVEHVITMLRRLERGVLKAAEVWKTGGDHFLAAFKVEKVRVDNIVHLIQLQRKSVIQMQSELIDLFTRSQNRVYMWSHMMQTMLNFSMQLSEVDALYMAVELLSTGRLPHFFVNHTTLARALVRLEAFLKKNNPELQLIQTNVRYYYQQSCFKVFRYTSYLVIMIEAPLTVRELHKMMDVYHVSKIPLVAPAETNHYTMLSTEVRAIIYHRDLDYYIPVNDLAFLPITDVLDLRNSPLLLRSRGIMTCESALMEGDLTDLKKLCRYYIIKANIPPGVIKLTNNDFLLSNVTKATLICKEQNKRTNTQYVLQLYNGFKMYIVAAC